MNQRIYLDESGINEYLHREYGRGLRGQKVLGEISGKRFARQSVISALFKGKFFAPMCFEGTCDASLFNTWLKEMLIPNLIPGQVLILDNASFDKSAESQKLVEAAGCKILFLPPYSPDLKPYYQCKFKALYLGSSPHFRTDSCRSSQGRRMFGQHKENKKTC